MSNAHNREKLALVSVSDKSQLVSLCQQLIQHNHRIVSTGGTAQHLRENHIEALDLFSLTQFEEILDGRVKTLHPALHAGILARKNQDETTLKALGFTMIDVVVVNLYPFKQAVEQSQPLEECIENIDIGGVALLRAAAKNHKRVSVISSPAQYASIIEELSLYDRIRSKTRQELAVEAFMQTASYDTSIAQYLKSKLVAAPLAALPPKILMQLDRSFVLRYGENPHQQGAFYVNSDMPSSAFAHFESSGGKSLSYNNLTDAECAWRAVGHFDEPTCVIVKHAVPCGVATASTIAEAWQLAYNTDPSSAFGGIVGLNRALDLEIAKSITAAPFIECIIAPDITRAGRKILTLKPNIRLITAPETQHGQTLQIKSVAGGLLIQTPDTVKESAKLWTCVTTTQACDTQLDDLSFAWKVAASVRSNAIVCAHQGVVTGIGSGQTSRIRSVELALQQAGDNPGVLASDAFFPFADSIHAAAAAGVKAIVQPGGARNDPEVIEAANQYGIAMFFTGVRHFSH